MSIMVLFILLAILVMLEVPVAFAMTLSAIMFLAFDGTISPQIVVQRLAPSLDSFPLLAVPMFILAGNLLNNSGITERIFDFALSLVGHIRGSLAHVNVLASIIFSGMSGVATADAAGLGKIEMQAMEREGFDKAFSAAVTGASSIIGPIIPPSTIMVIYAVAAGTSLSEMFLAGVLPGLLMGLVLMGTIYFLCITKKVTVPARPQAQWKHIWKTFISAVPGLLAPIVLIGGLLAGIATPTELSAIIVVYAIILGMIYRKLNMTILWECMVETIITCGVIVFVFAAASPFAWILAYWDFPQQLADTMMSLTSNKLLILLTLNIGLLFLGCFIETGALLLITVPVLAPLLLQINVDPVHFGIMLIINLMVGANTPPFGVILFVMMDVAKVTFSQYLRAFMPFYLPQLAILLIITLVPGICLWLPTLVGG
jgi:tripartite ATP-independent transporter DctM subunit